MRFLWCFLGPAALAIQLVNPTTIDAMTAVPRPSRWNAGIRRATSITIAPLMMSKKIPRLSYVMGRVRTTMIGRTKAFTMPSSSADRIMEGTSSKLMRLSITSASQRPREVISTREMNPRI